MKRIFNDFISFILIFLSMFFFYFIFYTNTGKVIFSYSGLIIFIFPFLFFLFSIDLNFNINKLLLNFLIFNALTILSFNLFTIINFNISFIKLIPKIIDDIYKIKYYSFFFNTIYISIFILEISYILEYRFVKKIKKEYRYHKKNNKKNKDYIPQEPLLIKYDNNGLDNNLNNRLEKYGSDNINLKNNISTNDNLNNNIQIDKKLITDNLNKNILDNNDLNSKNFVNSNSNKNIIQSNNLKNNETIDNVLEEKANIPVLVQNKIYDYDLNNNQNNNIITKNDNDFHNNKNFINNVENNDLSNKNFNSLDEIFEDINYPENLKPDEEKIIIKSKIIEKTLLDFGIKSNLINYHIGPVVTRFEFFVDEKVNLSKIEKIEKNISYNLSAEKIRILAPIPGKKAVGFEVPNDIKEIVRFKDFLKLKDYKDKSYELPLILGKDIDGVPYIIDLTETPHMLIAGRTGSGKSVCINSLINSLIIKKSPEELRIILIDPKRVELSLYEDLPHLLSQVLVYPDEAALSLKWLVMEMENRYNLLKQNKVRNIKDYNKIVNKENKMPYLVLIIDEFYALIQVAQKTIEDSLIRLSAMARAVGIHLIFATQRPSSDVITGVIKSNLPTRISFQTTSKTDSRIILDINGAESLLGNGDMLFSFGGLPPVRIQGTYISTQEVKKIVDFIKKKYKNFEKRNIIEEIKNIENKHESETSDYEEPLYKEAIEIIKKERRVSASYLQRRLKIGYNRAARIIEKMEEEGIIGPLKGNKERDIFI